MKKRTTPAPHAKLTPEQVLEIRRLARTEPQGWIARTYQITDGLVSQIVHRRAWRWLKAPAQAVALLIVAGRLAGASEVYEYPTTPDPQPTLLEMLASCDIAVGAFLSPNMRPRKECHYPLNNVVVFQKVKDGYLLMADLEKGITEPGLIFLKTKAPLKKGMRFDNEPVALIGTYQYESVDGFDKTVWAFHVVPPEAAQ